MAGVNQNPRFQEVLSRAIFALFLLNTATFALDMGSVDSAEEKSRNAFITRFEEFTQDKNVMGRPWSPSGRRVQGKRKVKFNGDNNLQYEGDLTDHYFVYNTVEETGEGKDKKLGTLYHFVSEHGKFTKAGGSSLLERLSYALHQKFTKQDEQNKEALKQEEKSGVKYRSIFKMMTQENKDDGKKTGAQTGASGAAKKKAEDEEKAERTFIRDEAVPEFEKAGKDSYESIEQASKDKGYENDEKSMPNPTLLYAAAGAATQAWWSETLANNGQRRANRGVKPGPALGERPQLSEGVPNCDRWAKELSTQIAQAKDQKQREALTKELEKVNAQCKTLTALPYNTIGGSFEPPDPKAGGGGGAGAGKGEDVLVTGDIKKEDPYVRDTRVQLEILAKIKRPLKSIPSNWKYDPSEEKVKRTEYDDKGNPSGEVSRTMKESLDTYDENLKSAEKGYDDVVQRYPDLKKPDMSKFYSKDKSAMEQNQPTDAMMEEFGLKQAPPVQSAKSYDQQQQMIQSQ